jgi:hypothetical protein
MKRIGLWILYKFIKKKIRNFHILFKYKFLYIRDEEFIIFLKKYLILEAKLDGRKKQL